MHELKKVAKELGEDLTEDEINHIFSKADLDEDRPCDFPRFLQHYNS